MTRRPQNVQRLNRRHHIAQANAARSWSSWLVVEHDSQERGSQQDPQQSRRWGRQRDQGAAGQALEPNQRVLSLRRHRHSTERGHG